MWKIAICVCAAFFISAKAKTMQTLDSRDVLDRINDAKKQITDGLVKIHIKALDFCDQASHDFAGYVRILNYRMNESIERIRDEVDELLKNASNTKKDCDVSSKVAEAAAAVERNVADCSQRTLTNAARNLSQAFYYSKNAKRKLDYQKLLASICRDTDDCKEILFNAYLIRNHTIASIVAMYDAFVNAIGDTKLLDDCINEDWTGYKNLSNFLSHFVSRTKECVASSVQRPTINIPFYD